MAEMRDTLEQTIRELATEVETACHLLDLRKQQLTDALDACEALMPRYHGADCASWDVGECGHCKGSAHALPDCPTCDCGWRKARAVLRANGREVGP